IAFACGQLAPSLNPWPFVIATLVAIVPVLQRALSAARAGVFFTIEMLMSIAAIGALVIGAAEEASVVVFLFAVGELLEGVAAARARRSISALSSLAPKTARLIEGETVREVPPTDLRPGQMVAVRPGDRIPCDGRIVEGQSGIDESPVNGESVPRAKGPGDDVFAGTMNIDAALRIEVTKAAADNTIARIVRLVEQAKEAKAPVERFIDRFARVYMPIVVAIALLVALVPPLVAGGSWGEWTYRALALLLIACPCALVISTPAAIAAGLSAGARRGLLIKGGAVLETLGGLRTVAFDKTGTLTEGRPRVTNLEGVDGSADETLRIAAALEMGSNHPIARAILARAAEQSIVPAAARDVRASAGRGLAGEIDGVQYFLGSPRSVGTLSPDVVRRIEELEAQGNTVAVLKGKTVVGLIAVRDEPRNDARRGLRALSRLGVNVIMLTGDNRRTADAVAAGLGIEARAELLPEDKARIVAELQASDRGPVGKVGDGINDAPALAAAAVGIAMGSGSDVAIETADAALLKNDVMGVAELIALSRATLANVRVNVAVALGSKAIFLVTTVLGLTGMWIAVLADTGATVLVTLNALRLLQFRFKSQ
ncbi:MAG: heavy metal translocating P-type ATPase, partial [Micropepsaceae bacterium]